MPRSSMHIPRPGRIANLQATTDGGVPGFITEAIASWNHDPASSALASMQAALATAAQAESILPAAKAAGGPVEAAVLAATSQADLDATVALAELQNDLAVDVADALGDLEEPRDQLQELGLAGTLVPDGSAAVAAVQAVDAEAATAEAEAIRSTIGGARDVGTRRGDDRWRDRRGGAPAPDRDRGRRARAPEPPAEPCSGHIPDNRRVTPTVEVKDNPAERRYEAWVDGALAGFSEYEPRDGWLVSASRAPRSSPYEGKGVGSKLAQGALDDVRARGLKLTPTCPFISSYIKRHRAYADLVVGVRGTPPSQRGADARDPAGGRDLR